MLLLLSAVVIYLLGFATGWFERDIRERLGHVTKLVVSLANKKPIEPEVESSLVEPTDDPIAAARAEFEARSERLNR